MANSTDWLFEGLAPAMEAILPSHFMPPPQQHKEDPSIPSFKTVAEVQSAIEDLIANQPEKFDSKWNRCYFQWFYKGYLFGKGIYRDRSYDCRTLELVIKTIPDAFAQAMKYMSEDLASWELEDGMTIDKVARRTVVNSINAPIETSRPTGVIYFDPPAEAFGGHCITLDCDVIGSRIQWSNPKLEG